MRILSLVFTVLLAFCASSAQAKEPCGQHDHVHNICKKGKFAKIFPATNQILIRKDGIFVYTANKKLVRGKFIAMENDQVYVAVARPKNIPKRGPCNLHRLYHKECGGCGVLLCPMNCVCFD